MVTPVLSRCGKNEQFGEVGLNRLNCEKKTCLVSNVRCNNGKLVVHTFLLLIIGNNQYKNHLIIELCLSVHLIASPSFNQSTSAVRLWVQASISFMFRK